MISTWEIHFIKKCIFIDFLLTYKNTTSLFRMSCRIFHEEALVLRDTKQKATTSKGKLPFVAVNMHHK